MFEENEIVCKCLFSIIRREPLKEQHRCISEIKKHYGDTIADSVMKMLESGN
jgi:hypothetical protein